AEREEPGEHDDSAEEDHRAAEAHGLVDEDEAAESQCAAEGVGDVEPGRAGDVAGIAAADELGRRPDRDEECVYGGDEDDDVDPAPALHAGVLRARVPTHDCSSWRTNEVRPRTRKRWARLSPLRSA